MLLKWCRGLFFHIYHWNFASNFFLYCLTGEKFRGVVIEKLKKCKITLTSKISPKCLRWCKCDDRFKSIRTPSILLIKVVTFDETSINDNITTQRNGNDVASITWTISISTNRVEIFQIHRSKTAKIKDNYFTISYDPMCSIRMVVIRDTTAHTCKRLFHDTDNLFSLLFYFYMRSFYTNAVKTSQ